MALQILGKHLSRHASFITCDDGVATPCLPQLVLTWTNAFLFRAVACCVGAWPVGLYCKQSAAVVVLCVCLAAWVRYTRVLVPMLLFAASANYCLEQDGAWLRLLQVVLQERHACAGAVLERCWCTICGDQDDLQRSHTTCWCLNESNSALTKGI